MTYDRNKVIAIALSFLHYHEKASNSNLDDFTANSGSGNYTRFARDLDAMKDFYNGPKQGFAWCDMFVDDCFVLAYGREAAQSLLCQPDRSAGAGCQYSAQYFNQKGQFFKSGPQPGDQIFYGSSWTNIWHTGLVVEVTTTSVVVVEGNADDQVLKLTYSLTDSRIWGYGRPDWGSSTADKAELISEPALYSPYVYYPRVNLLVRGNHGPQVLNMQRLLNACGFSCEVNGSFDEATLAAVKAFQKAADLDTDGEFGGQSFSKLWNWGR